MGKRGRPSKGTIGRQTTKAVGRPTKYKPSYCQDFINFCKDVTGFPYLQDFAHSIGVCRDTIYEWANTYPDFSDAFKKFQEIREKVLVDCALKGYFNPAFSIFTAKNLLGWKDRQEISASVTIEDRLAELARKRGNG